MQLPQQFWIAAVLALAAAINVATFLRARRRPIVVPSEARDPAQELVQAILQEGIERRKIEGENDRQRAELDKLRIQMEMEHLTELGEERRKDAAHREEMRQHRREAAAAAREKLQAKRAGAIAHLGAGICRVCVNPADPTLTPREINWHNSGHVSDANPFDGMAS